MSCPDSVAYSNGKPLVLTESSAKSLSVPQNSPSLPHVINLRRDPDERAELIEQWRDVGWHVLDLMIALPTEAERCQVMVDLLKWLAQEGHQGHIDLAQVQRLLAEVGR